MKNLIGLTLIGLIALAQTTIPPGQIRPPYNSFSPVNYPSFDQIHENLNFCQASNGTSAYTCKLPYRILTKYTKGMIIYLLPDISCSQNCTINIDGLGAISIKSSDGMIDGAVTQGQMKEIWFDGIVFRLL